MFVHKRQVWEKCDPPALPSDGGPKLDVHVIFTNLPGMRATLTAASGLARDLGARLTILVAQVVPYPLPLSGPPVPVEFTEQTLGAIASEQEVETTVKVFLCRDQWKTIRQALGPDSVVVIGGRKRWWRTAEQSLAAMLKRDGHHVVLVGS